jgi:hypothetical protein
MTATSCAHRAEHHHEHSEQLELTGLMLEARLRSTSSCSPS